MVIALHAYSGTRALLVLSHVRGATHLQSSRACTAFSLIVTLMLYHPWITLSRMYESRSLMKFKTRSLIDFGVIGGRQVTVWSQPRTGSPRNYKNRGK